jgi:hypothetical protein
MRWWWSALVLAESLHGQQSMPVGIIHGSLISLAGGNLSVRETSGVVYDCSYDSHTLFQRNQWPIHSTDLSGGEPVEILSDRKPARSCYVRMVSVVNIPQPKRHVPQREAWVPHGYLTYSGLVVKAEASTVTLKTRSGLRTLQLRGDTHYTEATEPLLNKHVFVRAGRTLQGALEAYQIVWGEIFLP